MYTRGWIENDRKLTLHTLSQLALDKLEYDTMVITRSFHSFMMRFRTDIVASERRSDVS